MAFDFVAGIIIDRDSDEPVYAQVARQIRARIMAGELPPGTALAGVRTLAVEIGVNLNTVARAYRVLEEEGFVIIRERSGAVVAAPPEQANDAVIEKLRRELGLVLARMRQAGLSPAELRRMVDQLLE